VVAGAVKVLSLDAAEKAAAAARRAAFYAADGDTLTLLLGGIRRFTKYDASGLLEAQRRLADAVVAGEKYPL
jgi:butyryl-CoA dehydrogenase